MTEEQIETKVPFYKNKKLVIPAMLVLALGVIVSAAAVYFHSTTMDLTVTEARSSADLPFSLACNSGETVTKDLTIHNAANVALSARLTFVEDENLAGVIYTDNLPKDISLAPSADTTVTVTFTCDEVTPAGVMKGTINYEKIVNP